MAKWALLPSGGNCCWSAATGGEGGRLQSGFRFGMLVGHKQCLEQKMNDAMKLLVEAVKAHALDHYEEGGWDYVVECFSDEEIAEDIGRARTVEGAIKKVKWHANLLGERRDEVQAEIF